MHTRRPLHGHLSVFVDWIATDDAREDKIREQGDDIRTRIAAKAREDGLVIKSTPWSGSFKKRTGLRRHMLGKHPVEGQDVDLVFVVGPLTKGQDVITSLLDRFMRYAVACYPDTDRVQTKSSIQLTFKGTKLSYDLVPMLAGTEEGTQILIRADGERRQTSVQKHATFVTARTKASNDLPGRVKFNECVRLFKWWREVVTGGEVDRLPSIMIDLMCAYAFDRHGVGMTYPETMHRWFGFLAHAVGERHPIYFNDFVTWPAPPTGTGWSVIDPVNPENNIASRFSRLDVDQIFDWLSDGRDAWSHASVLDHEDDPQGALRALVGVLGNPILHHCEK